MDNTDSAKAHDEFATAYDSEAKRYNSYTNEALFGMCYEYIKPGDSLLDLGIGTGLSSVLFSKAGLSITGLDESPEMLKECGKKGFAKEIRQHDIRTDPLPYSDKTFAHVVCSGVFHFFGDLRATVDEACRVLKSAGIFAFTIASLAAKDAGADCENTPDSVEVQSAWGIPIFKHSDKYIRNMTEANGLAILKEQKMLADSGNKDGDDIPFKIIVTRNNIHNFVNKTGKEVVNERRIGKKKSSAQR